MNASVGNQSLDRDLGDLASIGVEAREDDGAGRVVDDQLHAGGGFQRPDVPSLAADDATFEIVARQVDHRHGGLNRVFCGAALDGLRDDVFGLVRGDFTRFVLELLDEIGRVPARVGFQLAEQEVLGLVGRHARHALQLALGLGHHVPAARVFGLRGLLPLADCVLTCSNTGFGSIDRRLPVADQARLVPERRVERGDLLAPLVRVRLGFTQQLVRLLLGRKHGFLVRGFGLALGIGHKSARFVTGATHRVGGDTLACGDPDPKDDERANGGRERGGEVRKELHARPPRNRRRMLGPGRNKNPRGLPCGEVV